MSMPIPLREWIKRSRLSLSNEDYITCAVTVALELTIRLSTIVGSNSCAQLDSDSSLSSWNESKNNILAFDSLSSNKEKESGSSSGLISPLLIVRIEDVVPENVMVSVAINDNNHGESLSRANFTATEVNIQPSESTRSDILETRELIERDVCFALGSVLFELFSKGDPLLLVDLGSIDDPDDGESFSDSLLGDMMGNVTKKSSQSTTDTIITSQTKSMKANAFLQALGMPVSICQLVTDLLEAEEGNLYQSDTALISLEEALLDLMQMRTRPHRCLHGITCPTTALDKTCLFQQVEGEMYGREEEMSALMDTAERVSLHAPSSSEACASEERRPGSARANANDFLCEAVFLSGHSGSGKSTIIKRLVSFCNASDWFVLACKFDQRNQVMPLSALVQSFDAFFGRFVPMRGHDGQYLPMNPLVDETFGRISRSMIKTIDSESFCQLSELLPNLCQLFPLSMDYLQKSRENDTTNDRLARITQAIIKFSSPFGLGSGSKRLNYLLDVIFKAVCSGGHPVAFIVEDLQWSDRLTVDILGDFVQSARCSPMFSAEEGTPKGSLLLVGSFRDNEVDADGFLMSQIKNMEQSKENINVSRLSVGELSEPQINKMLSFKFCLPPRHTRELARLVHHKTRGNPMYTLEFLRSIIQRNMMKFSIKSRRWVWDDTSIDIHMISEGVVGLLTRKLLQLPSDVIETLKVVSCLGLTNMSLIKLLDQGQFVPDMQKALELGVEEGILEKAGPIFAFRHDLLQESTYNLIPTDEKTLLHKRIALSLARGPSVEDNSKLCIYAVDQINSEGMIEILDPVERALFSRLNLAAGKHSIAASSYEQARRYFEAGINLLHEEAWDRQYLQCLELHYMSVLVSFMDGNVETVSSQLDVILSNAKSFECALNSRVLRAKFLASQARYTESTNELQDILSNFGENFPQNACLSHVTSEVKATQQMLKDITKEKILNLPTMKDVSTERKMEYMGLLINFCMYSSPLLVPLLCCRMVKLTFECGFCEDGTISGLAFFSHVLLQYSDDVLLAARIGRIAESLMSGNIHEHHLRAKLTMWITSVKVRVEPIQAIVDHTLVNGYNSAKIAGDVDNALFCGMIYCIGYFFSISDLIGLQQCMLKFLHQMANHKRVGVFHSLMSIFDAVTKLIGNEDCSIAASIERKSSKELYQIAEKTQSTFLMHHVIINQMYVHCYHREHLLVADLAEKYRAQAGMNSGTKRVLDDYFVFFEGKAALCLARDTKQEKYRQIGEKSVTTMAQLAQYSAWNFENKLILLQAELHYLNQCHGMAELSYQDSIESAHNHRFFHEEAMAREAYGIYLLENQMVARGIPQLELAVDKYDEWGAMRKADSLKDFIELVALFANV